MSFVFLAGKEIHFKKWIPATEICFETIEEKIKKRRRRKRNVSFHNKKKILGERFVPKLVEKPRVVDHSPPPTQKKTNKKKPEKM